MTHAANFILFDNRGRYLAEIEPTGIGGVDWILNETGQVPFFMPFDDSKTTTDNLKLGNRLLVQFDNLPNWGGVLDTPRVITSTGVSLLAYSGERLLAWRYIKGELTFELAPPGSIFKAIIERLNVEHPTTIAIGDLYTGGAGRTVAYRYANAFDQIVNLARDSDNDFAILPVFSGGKLTFTANWYDTRGLNRANDIELIEGENAGDIEYREMDRIYNRIYVPGAGSSWGDERAVGLASNSDSQSEFDFREFSQTQSNVTGEAALADIAEAQLQQTKNPRVRLTLTATDESPGNFADYDIGDVVKVTTNNLGGDAWGKIGNYRLRSRRWNTDNTCSCTLDEA